MLPTISCLVPSTILSLEAVLQIENVDQAKAASSATPIAQSTVEHAAPRMACAATQLTAVMLAAHLGAQQ